jgi:putative membrane protein
VKLRRSGGESRPKHGSRPASPRPLALSVVNPEDGRRTRRLQASQAPLPESIKLTWTPAHERQPPGGERFDEAGDATRRTRLANERTYLAWWRTSLTAFAVSIGAGKLVPALATGASWPYTAIGIGFAIVGAFCSSYAFWRHREVEEAVSRGEFAPPDERLVALLSGIGATLGVLLVVVILTES